MYSYFAYGLGIHSDLPIPEFMVKKLDGEVFIRLKNNASNSKLNKVNKPYLEMGQEESVLILENVGIIQIRAGCEIVISPSPESDFRRIRRFIVGVAMAILLYQRGLLVLHASSVNTNDQAVAFLGFSGLGKSSIAAALYTHGYGVLADDVTVVDLIDDQHMVIPAFPQLKLSQESVEMIGCEVNASMLLDDEDEKYGYHLDNGFTETPLPLRRIYVLEENRRSGIEILSQQTALLKLISLSIPTLWTQLKDPKHFLQCVNLANLVPSYSLKRNSTIQSLPNFAEFVDNHLKFEIK